MGLPIRTRLLISFLGVLLAGMGLAAGLTWAAVERTYVVTQRQNLLAQARLSAAALGEPALQGLPLPLGPAQPYSQLANTQPGVHARLLSESGAVLIGLPLPPGAALAEPAGAGSLPLDPQALLARPEVRAALDGQASTALRTVTGAGGLRRRVLYAAAPVPADAQPTSAGSAAAGPADGAPVGAEAGAGPPTALVYLAMPLPPAGLPAGLAWQLGAALLLALGPSALAATLLARRLAGPVERVEQAARAVTGDDLLRPAPEASGVPELDSLGRAFNAMTAALRRAEQTRSAFTADVAHELRTPLTVIKGTLETLEDGALDDRAGRGALLAAMSAETERLIRLVNDLLLLARADAGALRLEPRPLDLSALARRRVERMSGPAARRPAHLAVDDRLPDGCLALADPDRLAQVLDNLLDNAIRHTAPGSTVSLRLAQAGQRLTCTVADQGEGIPPEHLELVFERFYRADSSRSRQSGGAGLGLAIARARGEAQGGT
ncbi:MAG: ATP-binding protein, partial [Chloroflexota bacterium]